jgi:putative spermidine/putrescine transport system permease protein
MESRATRIVLGVWTGVIVLFLLAPIALIIVYAFNSSNVEGWPITEFSTRWFGDTWHNTEIRDALWLSVRVGLAATVIAIGLGSAAAFAVQRFDFFGREAISFIVVLPLALPGIITGMALNSFVVNAPGFLFPGFLFPLGRFSLPTIVIGHATFCIVIVYNNVLARLRRTSGSLTEASMDLGADGWQTFRYVTWPVLSTALVAGGLLAFALSFDEVIVTYFTAGAQNTLPLWILGAIRQGTSLPQVNVVVLFWILLTLIPVAASVRLARDTGALGR